MRRLLYLLLAGALLAAAVGYYLWNKPHKNMESAKVDVALDAKTLFDAFNADENAANGQYLNKTIAVKGPVREVTTSADGAVKVVLDTGSDFGVLCELDPLSKHPRNTFAAGEIVTFKGLCAGLNFDVQLSRCVEVK